MGIMVAEVRIPPRNRALTIQMAEKIMRAAWYENAGAPPDKFVILIDTDRHAPEEVMAPFREQLPVRLGGGIGAAVQYAYAQQHLEAWYFADASNLRSYVGGALGSVDTSKPDEIPNPKLHLKNVLGDRVYTASVAEEIARKLDAATISERSPSFQGFMDAVMNGDFTAGTETVG